MDKRSLKSISIFAIILIYAIFYKLFIFTSLKEYCEAISASFMVTLFAISYLLFDFSKTTKTSISKNINWVVYGSIIVFFSLSYIYGIFAGFLKSPYLLNISSIIFNSIFIIVTIIFSELLRYNIVRANKDKKWIVYICCLVLTLFDIVISVKKLQFDTLVYGFKIITTMIVPIITKNVVLTYLYQHVDCRSGIIYRVLMETYVYFVPIIPKTSDYITSIIGVVVPILIYIYVSRMVDEHEHGVEKVFVSNTLSWLDIPAIAFSLILVCLISRAFPYYIVSIGSESMTGSIYKGDAVIIHKEKNKDNIKEGDIVAFTKSNLIIVHRVVDIEEHNGKKYYITKGDANNARDEMSLTEKDIDGVVKFNIKYIGYPSLWLSDLMN